MRTNELNNNMAVRPSGGVGLYAQAAFPSNPVGITVTCYSQAIQRYIYSFFPALRAPSFLTIIPIYTHIYPHSPTQALTITHFFAKLRYHPAGNNTCIPRSKCGLRKRFEFVLYSDSYLLEVMQQLMFVGLFTLVLLNYAICSLNFLK
jgi:hypothetical protein